VQDGLPIRAIGLLLLADSIEILVAALGVAYVFGGVPRLNSVKSLAKYSVVAVILAPASVASSAASALEGDSWWIGFFTEALALLTATPAVLSWVDIALTRRKKPKAYYLEAASMFIGLAALAYFTFVAFRHGKAANIALFTGAISVVGGVKVWNRGHQQLDRACRLPGDLGRRPRARSLHRRYARR